jgi:phosphonate transport system ATP-binding protein
LENPAIKVSHVSKTFERGKTVLKDVSIELARGEMVALIGASGSGKSTLVRAISGLTLADRANRPRQGEPVEGSIEVLGATVQRDGALGQNARNVRPRIGIVFQQFNLVPRLSVLTNVLMGSLGRIPGWRGTLGLFSRTEKQRAMAALQRVGIAAQALQRGGSLSGGQQQRAAIARTLVQGADVIIADEPIASLDPSSARRVMDILAQLNREDGITILVSLHQVEYALSYCPRTIALRQGEVVFDGPSRELTGAMLNTLYGDESESLFLPGLDAAAASPGSQAPRPPVRTLQELDADPQQETRHIGMRPMPV